MESSTEVNEDSAVWSVAVNKKPEGPYSLADLRKKFDTGEISLDHKLWKKGLKEWVKAKDLPEMVEIKAQVDALKAPKPRWHVAINGKPAGPFTDNEVESKIIAGEIEDKTKLWRNGQTDWRALAQIDELAPLRARAHSQMSAMLPPPLIDEPEAPPPLEEDSAPVVARPVPKPAAAPVHETSAAARQSVKAEPAAAQKTSATTPKTPSKLPARQFVGLTLNDAGQQAAMQIEALVQEVKALYPGSAQAHESLDVIEVHLKKAYLTGEPFALDAALGSLNNFIHVAHARLNE